MTHCSIYSKRKGGSKRCSAARPARPGDPTGDHNPAKCRFRHLSRLRNRLSAADGHTLQNPRGSAEEPAATGCTERSLRGCHAPDAVPGAPGRGSAPQPRPGEGALWPSLRFEPPLPRQADRKRHPHRRAPRVVLLLGEAGSSLRIWKVGQITLELGWGRRGPT
ncbi:uncharacterized protein LOC116562997 [Sapajus apella]|uniref:Uncharacterized protein LOC116562997 n=1 Tax=Sapajus apella TaxID=9515 RepID=A0A6J3JAI1_SAPAP|nr:uncharacterized protein LOC116562997 [Sapajus apella]